MITLSINPSRADVGLNLEYAEVQLDRALRKASRHHRGNFRLIRELQNALVSVRLARLYLRKKGRP